jgi:hypothetical protein
MEPENFLELPHTEPFFTLLESVPLGVTTWTFPLLAPAGTVAVISRRNETTEDSRRAVKGDAGRAGQIGPQNLDAAPTLPEVGCVSTNGPRPTDRLKTVPP